MNNSFFIADQDSRCGKKITDVFLLNDFKVIQTVIKNKSLDSKEGDEKDKISEQKLIPLEWNCFSTVSPKNVVLQLRQITVINTAAVILTPPEDIKSFVDQTHMEIQKSIDFYIRSQIILAKEIITELKRNSPSYLYLVLNSTNRDDMYTSVYRAIINSLLKGSDDDLYINCVENNSDDHEQFADYFFSIVGKNRKTGGKWYKPFQMNSIFSGFSLKQ